MKKEAEILEKLKEKLKQAENMKASSSAMERYREGLVTAYIEAISIVKST